MNKPLPTGEGDFNLVKFNPVTPENLNDEAKLLAEEAFDIFLTYVVFYSKELNVADPEIQPFLSEFDISSYTYDRTSLFFIYLASKLQSNAEPVKNIVDINTIEDWQEIVNNYNNPHFPVFGIFNNQILIWDPRLQLEIKFYITNSDQKNKKYNFEFDDKYRMLLQTVNLSYLNNHPFNLSLSTKAYDTKPENVIHSTKHEINIKEYL